MPIVARGENPAADHTHDVAPELRELVSPAFFAGRPKGDRTAVFAVIFARNQNADENRGATDCCDVLWRCRWKLGRAGPGASDTSATPSGR